MKKLKDLNILLVMFGFVISAIIGYYSGQIGIESKINDLKLIEKKDIFDLKVKYSILTIKEELNEKKIEKNNKTIEKTYLLINTVNSNNDEIKRLLFKISNNNISNNANVNEE